MAMADLTKVRTKKRNIETTQAVKASHSPR